MLLDLFEYGITILIATFLVTQIIWPGMRGTPMFPFFQAREDSISRKIAKVRQEVIDTNLETELRKKEAELDALRRVASVCVNQNCPHTGRPHRHHDNSIEWLEEIS